VWASQCTSDPEICMHECVPVIRIAAPGGAGPGDKGTHDVRACLLHSGAWVRNCVVDRHTLMRSYVHDMGTWKCPCRVSRHALMCTCGMDRHASGVNMHAYVRACGLKNRALGERLTGVKLIFLMVLMVNMDDLRLCDVDAGDHCARCQSAGKIRIGLS
jgi:hypothetical protein